MTDNEARFRLKERGVSPDMGFFHREPIYSDRMVSKEVQRDLDATFVHIQGDDRLNVEAR
jgi:hypothetical protein